ncbi:MAG: hypothetical protein ACK5JL_07865, partial [Candidatus Kapaibacterium sp.]
SWLTIPQVSHTTPSTTESLMYPERGACMRLSGNKAVAENGMGWVSWGNKLNAEPENRLRCVCQ